MANETDSWNIKMVNATQAIRLKSEELTKAQKQRWKETYLAQFEDIITAEADLQRNWGSKEARDKLSEAQVILHIVRQRKFEFQESATFSKWARVGDRCTKEFFEFHEGQRQPITITSLRDGERILPKPTSKPTFSTSTHNCTFEMTQLKRLKTQERTISNI
jgi:hypothetical protein